MMTPHINLEDSIGKTVGRRIPPHATNMSEQLQQTGAALFARWGHGMPKGVYRYRSHEEAEQDLIRHYVRKTQ